MKKEVLGLSRKELLLYASLIMVTVTLITYSSLTLIHKYSAKDEVIYNEIQNHSKDLVYLNDLSVYAINIQRNSLNILVYRRNHSEVVDFISKIESNRDSLLLKLSKMEGENIIDMPERKQIVNLGIEYLEKTSTFLQMFNDSISNDKLSQFNTDKMRPVIRKFSDLNRKVTRKITSKIKSTVGISHNILWQVEFWLLILGLAPYLYFLYRILSILVRMVLWEIFPKK